METAFVKSIEAEGIFGRFDFEHKFEEGINIIYGKNGAGKTTLLHILANALSGDFGRFNHLEFKTIKIKLSSKKLLVITKHKIEGEKTRIEASLNKELIYPGFHNIDLPDLLLSKQKKSSSDITIIKESLFLNDLLKEASSRSEQIELLKEVLDQISHDSSISSREREKLVYQLYSRINIEGKGNLYSLLSIAYFPAFRTMIEAWAATNASKETRVTRPTTRVASEEWKSRATEQARDWFGAFTPTVNFPSLVDIEDELTSEIFRARNSVWNKDRDLLSQAFLKVFTSLSDRSISKGKGDDILNQIQELFTQLETSPLGMTSTPIYRELREELLKLHTKEGELEPSAIRILKIYWDVLDSSLKEQQRSFENIEKYISSVNEFLEDKKYLAYKVDVSPSRQQWLGVKFEDGSFHPGLRTLSSGERQIITLIYASTHMSQQNVVLIDEPEISLHIDWQRKLISKMSEHIGNRQIIACTHSPVIAADYQDQMKEFQFSPSKTRTKQIVGDVENEELVF